eukprot:UN17635
MQTLEPSSGYSGSGSRPKPKMKGRFSLGANKEKRERKVTAGSNLMDEVEIQTALSEIERNGFWSPEPATNNVKTLSPNELHSLHKQSSEWIECKRPDAETRKSIIKTFPDESFQLYFCVTAAMFKAGEDNYTEL